MVAAKFLHLGPEEGQHSGTRGGGVGRRGTGVHALMSAGAEADLWLLPVSEDAECALCATQGENAMYLFQAYGYVRSAGRYALGSVLTKQGIPFSDFRAQGGALWAYGDQSLRPAMNYLQARGFRFEYMPPRSRRRHSEPAWWWK